MQIRFLSIGSMFSLMGEPMVLLKKNDCRALVRGVARVHREFESATGEIVAFDAPAGAYSVSPSTEVEEARSDERDS